MMMTKACSKKRQKAQAGVSLISVMIAVLVFSFGTLALLAGYVKAIGVSADNRYFTDASILAESMRSAVAANPSTLLPLVNNFSSANTQTNTVLSNWVSQLTSTLPSGSASARTINPNTNAAVSCTTAPCTVELTINWQKDLAHQQIYNFQIGF